MTDGMKRIIMHWTAGGGRASDLDREHYHRLVEYDGNVVQGTEDIADNIVTSDGDYAAHVLNLNTGSIGVAMCGMRGATEHPFDPGPSPVTEGQFNRFCDEVAELCRAHGIPVSMETVLTHAEVQPTLGVKQRGKWDFTRLPFAPDMRGPIQVGNHFRTVIWQKLEALGGKVVRTDRPTLRTGDRGAYVLDLQDQLVMLDYQVGRVDGVFGRETRAAVLAFQADNGLATDAVVGPRTWDALRSAPQRPVSIERQHVSSKSLRDQGSRTIEKADEAEDSAAQADGSVKVMTGVAVAAGGFLGSDDAADKIAGARNLLEAAQGLLLTYWPLLIVAGIAAVVVVKMGGIQKATRAIRDARTEDARTGANMRR